MQALEIGHFRGIAGFYERFEARTDQFNQTAAQDDLFTEQIGFALFLEAGFDHASPAATIG